MYMPSHFEEKRIELLHGLIVAQPFGTLVTVGSGGIEANHLPFELDPGAGEFGTLRAHVARANPVWREFSGDVESLVIFQGAHAYVSPSWYPAKREHGKVVPTWNYMVVHAYGTVRVVDDPAWKENLVTRLTERHEAGRSSPWKVSDAPRDYLDKMLDAIVGIEIPVTRVIGKWKVSQNRSAADRAGAEEGLRADGTEFAAAMADAVAASAR